MKSFSVSGEGNLVGVGLLNVEAYKRSLAQRVSLNRQILQNKYWFLPVDNKGHEDFVPVGRGVSLGVLWFVRMLMLIRGLL